MMFVVKIGLSGCRFSRSALMQGQYLQSQAKSARFQDELSPLILPQPIHFWLLSGSFRCHVHGDWQKADSVRFWGTLSWVVTAAIDPALRRIGGNSFVLHRF
jgi:hypothetical protein